MNNISIDSTIPQSNIDQKFTQCEENTYINILQGLNNINTTNLSEKIKNYSSSSLNNINNCNSVEKETKQKQRKKIETKERNYKCKFCEKTYLSYPALYTHCKTKHEKKNICERGRGRPKKYTTKNNIIYINKYNPLNSSFFLEKNRTGYTDPNNINNCIINAFNNLYNNNKENIKKLENKGLIFYNNINSHPFLGKYFINAHDINKFIENENEIIDTILMDYLNKMSTHCSEKYFEKLIIFVTLFREHVNIIRKNDNRDNLNKIQYTQNHSAENIPDTSNEFIIEFMFPENIEENFGFYKDEVIALTQNLCYWMYENNFTSTKLTLINNN